LREEVTTVESTVGRSGARGARGVLDAAVAGVFVSFQSAMNKASKEN
jgi:hypothetical protein